LRLLNSQLKAATGSFEGDVIVAEKKVSNDGALLEDPSSKRSFDMLLERITRVTEENSVTPIIVYYPPTQLSKNGDISYMSDDVLFAYFKNYFSQKNISVIDMRARFSKFYEEKNILPFGFLNSPVGSGHMNKYGHALTAEALFDEIKELEKAEN
jgi:hypothetical protein